MRLLDSGDIRVRPAKNVQPAHPPTAYGETASRSCIALRGRGDDVVKRLLELMRESQPSGGLWWIGPSSSRKSQDVLNVALRALMCSAPSLAIEETGWWVSSTLSCRIVIFASCYLYRC